MRQFVFGYGSLIEKESRMLTVPDAKEAIPVKVTGLVRGWWARTKVEGFSTTYLGCLSAGSELLEGYDVMDWLNGVIFEVSQKDIDMLDDREKNYKRVQIQRDKLSAYGQELPDDMLTWVYINEFENKDEFLQSFPSKEFPLVQSYVDICLNGCLEMQPLLKETGEAVFLKDFIETTNEWSPFWANDRIFPRRPHAHCKNAFLIDRLLKENLKDKTIFDSIYIE